MVVYLVPILLCLLSAISRELSDNRRWTIMMGVILCLFLCFGYMTGTDWKTYEYWYDHLDFNRFYYGYVSEPGYYIYMMIMNKLGIPFWPFLLFTKCLLFILVFKSLYDYSKESIWLSLMYYLPWFGLYFFIDNPLRNCIAVGVFMLSTKYILEHKFWKFFWMTLLAASFHVTALFLLFLYPVYTKDVKKWVYLVLFVVINIVFMNRELVVNLLTVVLGKIPVLQNKVLSYFLLDSVFAQGKDFSFGLVWQMALFVLILCYKERIVEQIGGEKGMFAFNAAMIYFLLVRFAMSFQILMRLQLYFSVYVCVCIGLAFLSFKWRSRLLYLALYMSVTMYVCVDKITGTGRFIPYTNIVDYCIRGEFPSFSQRYLYNIDNSPYTIKQDFEQ